MRRRKCVHDTLAAWMRVAKFLLANWLDRSFRSAAHSYYGLTFLLPKYFMAISGDSDDSKFILSIVLGIVYAPGMSKYP